ncbi:MAG: hypothetical protein CMP10_10945 [Zetaproteobacteria bacterium]|nr:hypothetical protein [Pseudobdellovibrionaceae bacterium]
MKLNYILLLALMGWSPSLDAGTVHSCKNIYRKVGKSKETKKLVKCVMKLPEGNIGDIVEVKNQSNYIIATGKILKRRGQYVSVILTDVIKTVRSQDLVSVRNQDSNDQWTATKAPF